MTEEGDGGSNADTDTVYGQSGHYLHRVPVPPYGSLRRGKAAAVGGVGGLIVCLYD